ncbi:MAG: class I SAM-dependent methyltransferase [Anaerolineae bacterium]|nr:class I SAM-dependent methyltransferase [Gloeobacterales cyanobacterium ES-bin-313]
MSPSRRDYDDHLLARLYDAEYDEIDADLSFYLDHLEPGSVLELACGTGRLAVSLSRQGRQVVGLDAAPAMIARARQHPEPVEWVVADMANFSLERTFGNIVIPFSGLAFLPNTETQLRCLACCRQHLSSNGLLILDLMNPETSTGDSNPLDRTIKDPLTEQIFTKTTQVKSGLEKIEIFYTYTSGAIQLNHTLNLCRISLAQITEALEISGFFIHETYGDYRSNPYTSRSPRLLLIAIAM